MSNFANFEHVERDKMKFQNENKKVKTHHRAHTVLCDTEINLVQVELSRGIHPLAFYILCAQIQMRIELLLLLFYFCQNEIVILNVDLCDFDHGYFHVVSYNLAARYSSDEREQCSSCRGIISLWNCRICSSVESFFFFFRCGVRCTCVFVRFSNGLTTTID